MPLSLRQTRHILKTRHALAGLSPRQKREALRRGAAQMAELEKLPPLKRVRRRKAPDLPHFPVDPLRYQWFVLVTRARSEAKAARSLAEVGAAPFCPMEIVEARTNSRARNRRHEIYRPILTSLLPVGFAWGEDVPWLHLLDRDAFPDIVAVIAFDGKPARLPYDALFALRDQDGRQGRTRHYTAMIGDEVRVTDGKFSGIKGRVVDVKDGQALIELLGLTGVLAKLAEPAEMPEDWLEEA